VVFSLPCKGSREWYAHGRVDVLHGGLEFSAGYHSLRWLDALFVAKMFLLPKKTPSVSSNMVIVSEPWRVSEANMVL